MRSVKQNVGCECGWVGDVLVVCDVWCVTYGVVGVGVGVDKRKCECVVLADVQIDVPGQAAPGTSSSCGI